MKMNKYKLILGALSLGLITASSVSAEEYVTKEEFLQLQKQMSSLRQELAAAQTQVPSRQYKALEEKLEKVEKTSANWENWISRDMQYYRQPGKEGINVFEAPKTTDVAFDGVKVRIGGASTLQFQGITHDNSGAVPLDSLSNNFNLATANLDLDVALAEGVRMHLRTYLSSRHHEDAWVKGGYLQVDSLDAIQEGFLSGLMENVRIKVGHMEPNYGDNHFRRSDNADAMYNPFVGNYIMDSFSTEVGGEIYYFEGDYFAMIGATNGKLNQSVHESSPLSAKPSYLGKLGYDSQINQDLRVRLTGSVYYSPESPYQYLYTGDRGGARYYDVMNGNFRSGRVAPGFAPYGADGGELTAFMVNPFVKYKGWEFYGVLESVSGKSSSESSDRTFNQYGVELLYRFGAEEAFYVGGRYNLVDGELASGEDIEVDRINIGGGWFITDNVLTKLEYVTQSYDGYPAGDRREDGEFSGIVLEAAISY